MQKYKILIVFAFLIGIASFSLFRYRMALMERQNILDGINKIRFEISKIELEQKQLTEQLEEKGKAIGQLLEEKQEMAKKLNSRQERLASIEEALGQAQKTIDQLRSEAGSLKEENLSLKQEKDVLIAQADVLTQEKSSLEARLSSVAELKKAIRELKRKIRQAKTEVIKKVKVDKNTVSEGNHGFVVKDGQSTLGAKIKIEVIPVQ
jgi:chromosome segregation ATPase